MVADPATEMAAMRVEITAMKEDLAKASVQFNELQTAQAATPLRSRWKSTIETSPSGARLKLRRRRRRAIDNAR